MKASKIVTAMRRQNPHVRAAASACEVVGHALTFYLERVLNKRRAPQMSLEEYLSGVPVTPFRR